MRIEEIIGLMVMKGDLNTAFVNLNNTPPDEVAKLTIPDITRRLLEVLGEPGHDKYHFITLLNVAEGTDLRSVGKALMQWTQAIAQECYPGGTKFVITDSIREDLVVGARFSMRITVRREVPTTMAEQAAEEVPDEV